MVYLLLTISKYGEEFNSVAKGPTSLLCAKGTSCISNVNVCIDWLPISAVFIISPSVGTSFMSSVKKRKLVTEPSGRSNQIMSPNSLSNLNIDNSEKFDTQTWTLKQTYDIKRAEESDIAPFIRLEKGNKYVINGTIQYKLELSQDLTIA